MEESSIRDLFRALERGESDPFFAHVADDVDWTVFGSHPLAGVYRDKRELRTRLFERLTQLLQAPLRIKLTHLLVHDDRAAVELDLDAISKRGQPFHDRHSWLLRFEGARIVEVRTYLDSASVQALIDQNESGTASLRRSTQTPRVALIGLGHMGRGMAEALRARGFPLRVWNRTRQKADDLDAEFCDSPAEAVAGAELVLTSLSDDRAVRDVVYGDSGVLAALDEHATHMSASTISCELGAELEKLHAERGRGFLSAPVLGRPEAAAAGKLFVLAGGSDAARETCRPLLEAIGQHTFVFADAHSANLAKILLNLMLGGTIELLGEVLTLGEKGGIDPQRVVELLTGTLFGCPAINGYAPRIAKREFDPAAFRMPLGLKDVELALAAGKALRVPLPAAAVVRDMLISGIARGLENSDWSALTTTSRVLAGLPAR